MIFWNGFVSQVSVYKIQQYHFYTLQQYCRVIILKIVALHSVCPHMDYKLNIAMTSTNTSLYGFVVKALRALTGCTSLLPHLCPWL